MQTIKTNIFLSPLGGIKRGLLLLGIIGVLFPFTAIAQEKVITNTKSIGVGYNSMQDTYLSPEHYGGMELRYVSHTLRENGKSPFSSRRDSSWTRLIINEGMISNGKSRSENGNTLGISYHFQYGMLHRWNTIAGRLRIQAGPQGELLGGALYNTRNGNNPVQVRAQLNLGIAARADYRIGRYRLDYEVSTPLLGLTFSPNYGQSYYEIFSEGNYDRNCVPTTFICSPSLRQTLTFSIPVRKRRFTVGYLGEYRQQHVNNIKQHVYSHSLLLGLTITR